MIIPKKDEPRIEYLARILYQFMQENPIAAECTIGYDEAICDGNCLAQDILDELNILEVK